MNCTKTKTLRPSHPSRILLGDPDNESRHLATVIAVFASTVLGLKLYGVRTSNSAPLLIIAQPDLSYHLVLESAGSRNNGAASVLSAWEMKDAHQLLRLGRHDWPLQTGPGGAGLALACEHQLGAAGRHLPRLAAPSEPSKGAAKTQVRYRVPEAVQRAQ